MLVFPFHLGGAKYEQNLFYSLYLILGVLGFSIDLKKFIGIAVRFLKNGKVNFLLLSNFANMTSDWFT